MQNENVENQPNQPQRNPSRDNRNVSSGQQNQSGEERGNEKNFGSTNNSPEINPGKLDHKEIDLDRSGVGNSQNRESTNFSPDEESSYNGPGSPQTPHSQGGNNIQTQQAGQQRSDVKNPSESQSSEKNFTNQADGQQAAKQGLGGSQGSNMRPDTSSGKETRH